MVSRSMRRLVVPFFTDATCIRRVTTSQLPLHKVHAQVHAFSTNSKPEESVSKEPPNISDATLHARVAADSLYSDWEIVKMAKKWTPSLWSTFEYYYLNLKLERFFGKSPWVRGKGTDETCAFAHLRSGRPDT